MSDNQSEDRGSPKTSRHKAGTLAHATFRLADAQSDCAKAEHHKVKLAREIFEWLKSMFKTKE